MRSWLGVLALAALAAPLYADDKSAVPVKQGEIVVEGEGSVGSIAFEPVAGRVYLGHGADLEVYDLAKKEKVGTVEGVERPRGIVILPDLHRGYVASAKKDRLVVFDLEAFKITKEVATGDGPETVLYVASAKEIWVLNSKQNSITCFDPDTLETKTTVRLEGKPAGGVEHATKGLVYVALVDPDGIGVVDARTHKVQGAHPVDPGTDPKGLALDPTNNILFIGCGNLQMVVLETNAWKPVSSSELSAPGVAGAFDSVSGNAFVVCEDRTRVLHVNPGKKPSVLPSLDTTGAKACAFEAKSRRLFITCGPKKGEEGAEKVVVFGPK